MIDDVKRFIKTCPICQKIRHGQGAMMAALSTTIRTGLFERIAIDTVGPLPVDEDQNQYIIVMICSFSRFTELYPSKDASALSAAKAVLDLIGRYGCPLEIQSDQGTQYANELMSDLSAFLKINQRFTLPYRPQANGMVERVNQEVMRHLRAIVYERRVKRNWSLYLPLVQRIINTSVHSSIGTTPSRVVFGDKAYLDRGFGTNDLPTQNNDSEHITYEDHIQELNEHLKDIASVSAQHQKKIFDAYLQKSPIDPTTFNVGELVLVSYPDRPPDKLTANWRGPLVVQSVENQTYFCQDLITLHVSPFFVDRLKRFTTSEEMVYDPQALAALDKDELVVDAIVGHTGSPHNRKDMTFRVRWKGDEVAEDSWEPWQSMKDLQALDLYIEQNPKLNVLRHNRVLKRLNKDIRKTKADNEMVIPVVHIPDKPKNVHLPSKSKKFKKRRGRPPKITV
jgi:hypothetical protein